MRSLGAPRLLSIHGIGFAATAWFLLAVGCNSSTEDPATLAMRDMFLVTSPLENPISMTQAAEKLEAKAADSAPLQVTVVGRISAGDLEPWEAGKASFMLAELPEDGHGEGHDADNCPFCKRRAAKALTGIVKFVDDKNETLAIDARKLFGLEKDQHVAIRGTAIAGEFNTIVLVADQIYVFP